MTRKDRFIWYIDDIEVHRVAARAIAYDAARILLRGDRKGSGSLA